MRNFLIIVSFLFFCNVVLAGEQTETDLVALQYGPWESRKTHESQGFPIYERYRYVYIKKDDVLTHRCEDIPGHLKKIQPRHFFNCQVYQLIDAQGHRTSHHVGPNDILF